jgi:hypothetical protein
MNSPTVMSTKEDQPSQRFLFSYETPQMDSQPVMSIKKDQEHQRFLSGYETTQNELTGCHEHQGRQVRDFCPAVKQLKWTYPLS